MVIVVKLMTINKSFDNLPLCIIDGCYPKDFDNLLGTLFFDIILITYVVPKTNSKKNLHGGF
jgi:hypothetical protein